MSRRHIIAAIAAAALGLTAGACGDRESVEQSNPGQEVPEGTPSTVETGEGITPSGETQETVTQGESP